MRRTALITGVVLLLAGVFWTGRESGHGLTALWEHWWCPVPLALILIGIVALIAVRRSAPAT